MEKYPNDPMGSQMGSQAAAAADRTSAAFQSAVSEGQDLLKATADQAAEKYAAARARVQEGVTQAKQRMDETQAMLADRATYAADMTKSYVVANPWKAVAIVGSVGVVLGMLMSGRRHHHYE